MLNMHVIHAGDFMETTVAGALDYERSRAMLLGIARANEPRHLNLLIDLRGAYGGAGISFPDVFRLVAVLEEHPDAFRGNRVALLDEFDEQLEKTQFFEASATHKGFHVRTFIQYEAALRWLHGAPEVVR